MSGRRVRWLRAWARSRIGEKVAHGTWQFIKKAWNALPRPEKNVLGMDRWLERTLKQKDRKVVPVRRTRTVTL